MSYIIGGDVALSMSSISRIQEKEELQRLNDRFSSYIQHVRQLREQSNNVDSSAVLKSAKILEDEINNLKNLYEQELEKLREEIEVLTKDKTRYQVQSTKHQQATVELQDRLMIETDKNRKLMDEINNLQRKNGNLEAELQDTKIAANRPVEDINNLNRTIDNITRDCDTVKRRYDREQVARQEAEDKVGQLMKKLEFNEQVHSQQVREFHDRIEMSTATILSLEARIRDLSKSDTSVPELLKQVRDAAEGEFKKYQIESETQYNRNITSLKTQMDHDASTIESLQSEKTALQGSVGELQAKIRSLEGQVSNLQHQKQSLEDAVNIERNRAADGVRLLEKKLREVQDLLFAKMREVTSAREANIPLKAEIEALKALMEEEERRLRLPMSLGSGHCQTSILSAYDKTQVVTSPQPHVASPPVISSNITPRPSSSPYIPAPSYIAGPHAVGYAVDASAPAGATTIYEPEFTASCIPHYLDVTEPITSLDLPTSSSRYMYETSPSVNRLQVDPSPPETPRPIGPVNTASMYTRAKSAPATHGMPHEHKLPLVPISLGQGKDYFDEMFNDLQRDTLYTSLRPKSSPLTSTYHDYTVATTSAIGDVKILEVHQNGKYVRLLNDGPQEIEFGGYMVQQNVGGHPVAVYRFPPRTKFPPNSKITVWSGSNDPILHQPPTDFVWREQQKWGTGPECTTILCRPNGQAIAWTTAAHRFTRNAFSDAQVVEEQYQGPPDLVSCDEEESLTELNVDINGGKPEPVYLRREKQQPPGLAPSKHPHGCSPATLTHPHTGQARPLVFGNDHSTRSRQSRSQSTRPDPVPGQPYAGAAAQRMGSAPLRQYVASQNMTVSGNGKIANKAAGTIRFGPPTPFLSPLQQEYSQAYSNRSTSLVRFTA